MIIWLVLVVSGVVAGTESPRMMHVGNFTSYIDCQEAAKQHTVPIEAPKNPPQITMLSVPANRLGTQPPPY